MLIDVNQLLVGGGVAGTGGGILFLVVKFMIRHAKEITKCVYEMNIGVSDLKDQLTELKTDVRSQVGDIKKDVSQLRDHIHANELYRNRK